MSAQKTIEKHGVTHLVFDIDGTLYPSTAGIEHQIRPAMWATLANHMGTDVPTAHATLWQIIMEDHDEAMGLQRLGINLDKFYEQVYNQLDLSAIEAHPDLLEQLKRLSDEFKLVAFSNSSRSHVARVLAKFSLTPYFSRVVSFEDSGYIRKPDRRAFLSLLDGVGVAPHHVLYFDDNVSNLYTAYMMEFNTVMVSNKVAPRPLYRDMHMKMNHDQPEFVDDACFDILEILTSISAHA